MSDQDKSIFGSDQSQTPESKPQGSAAQGAADQLPAELALLVGADRKYKNVSDLVKGVLHLTDFAETLKGENAQLREKVAASGTIEDVLQQLKQGQPASGADHTTTQVPNLSAETIASLVKQTVTGMETERSKRINLEKADALMKKHFGEKAKEVFSKEASDSGKRDAYLNLAAVDPEKFVSLFVPQGQAAGSADNGTDVNTAALSNANASGRALDPECKEFYDAMRKKDPKRYFSSEIQLAIHQAAQKNKAKYFGISS